MAVPALNDIYQVTIRTSLAGQVFLSTFKYKLTTVGTEVTVDALYSAIETQFTAPPNVFTKFVPALPFNWSIVERWYQRVFPIRIRKKVFISGLLGTWPQNTTSTNQAVSLERFAEIAGRHGVGRLQMPASNSPLDITAGVISNPAYKAALANLAATFSLPLTTAPGGSILTPVLQSVATPAVTQPIVGSIVQDTLRTMRRRTVGVGK